MKDQDNGKIRGVAWLEVFPWLNIARSFRIAIQVRLLALSAAGLALMLGGWAAIGWLFSGDRQLGAEIERYQDAPSLAATDLIPKVGGPPEAQAADTPFPAERSDTPGNLDRVGLLGWTAEPVWHSAEQLSRPFRGIFAWNLTRNRLAFLLLCGLWTLAVWSYFGGAVSRAAAYELATQERLGVKTALRFARTKWRANFAAVALPLLGAAALVVPVALLGLFLRFDLGVIVAGLFWPLALACGFVLGLLVVGLLFGWPLLAPAISAEGTDSFDAIGRAYNYTYQRPLNYLFYAAVAAVIGLLGWIAVSYFAGAIIGLTWWAASWGAGADAVKDIAKGTIDFSSTRSTGVVIVRFWIECLKLLAAGYLFSYFWTAATAVYFQLRRNVDAMELDEVFLEEEEPPPAPLPPVQVETSGTPVMATPGETAE